MPTLTVTYTGLVNGDGHRLDRRFDEAGRDLRPSNVYPDGKGQLSPLVLAFRIAL